MTKFPADAPNRRVVKTLEKLGFRIVRKREHISMVRQNPDGTSTPPHHAESSKNQDLDLEDHLHPGGNSERRFFKGLSRDLSHPLASPSRVGVPP